MAFSGVLVSVNNSKDGVYTLIPNKYIFFDSYKVTPDQIIDLDSGRDTTGVLHRNALSHRASKMEFGTPPITNAEWNTLWEIITSKVVNKRERYLYVRYYDPLTDEYKKGKFYIPDVEFTIERIDEAKKIIFYDKIRLAFIEY